MPISKDFTSILTSNWEINFLQCYPNGYLKYTELCNIFQLIAAKHAEMGGISFTDMQVHHQAWVMSRMRVEIKKMPKWRDKITVKTWINSLENSRSIRCIELFMGDEKIAGCETFWAVFNTKNRKPESLALEHQHFEKYPNDKANTIQFSKIDTTIETTSIATKTILLSDLDIVNHANSVKYLEWCLDYVEPKLLFSNSLESFEMNYIKEVSLNECITIEKSTIESPIIYKVNSGDKTCFVLQLNWK
jgi:medium-chain acyl-[acyl-carrier-protein] hydrolase